MVEKLTETRAFYGFARLNNEKSVDDSIKNIRVSEPKKMKTGYQLLNIMVKEYLLILKRANLIED